ncbi:MAG: P-loop NTPase fold protein [Meiothermus sp.]|nr:P-loop NTPase fold protein [Meiothermus sp.]
MGDRADLGLDRAILTLKEDRLGHGRLARELVRSVQVLQAEGIVVGVQGTWGSGKSSLLNLVEEVVKAEPSPPVVIRFNPWWFSGREDLYRRFFKQFASELRLEAAAEHRALNTVADGLEKMGAVASTVATVVPDPFWKPVLAGVGSAFGLAKWLKRPEPSLDKLRSELAQELKKKGQPIWVFVDDLDRLEAAEMLQMFALVRSLADFPWVSYFVAFDPVQVAEQIKKEGYKDPQNYLEKILDLSISIPQPNPLTLAAIFVEGLMEIFSPVPESQEEPWVGFYLEHKPLVPTVRRIKRLLHAVRVAKALHRDEVHRDDLIGMELLRAAVPEVYQDLPAQQTLFAVGFDQGVTASDTKEQAQRRQATVEAWSSQRRGVAAELNSLLARLFPVLDAPRMSPLQARSERRICDPVTFSLYYQLREREIPTARITALLEESETSAEPLEQLLKEQAESPIPFVQTSAYLRELTYAVAARDQRGTLEPQLAINLVRAVVRDADRWLEGLGGLWVGDSLTVRLPAPLAQISRQRMTLVSVCMGGFELVREKDVAKVKPFLEALEQSNSPIWSHSLLTGVADEFGRRQPLDPDQKALFASVLTQLEGALEQLEEPVRLALEERLRAGQGWPESSYFLPLLKTWNQRGDERYAAFFAELSPEESLPLLNHLAAMARERTFVRMDDLRPILDQVVINGWIERLEREGTPVPELIKTSFAKFFGD